MTRGSASPTARPQACIAWPPERIGRLAVRALYHEAVLYPKPGLVSAQDSGAHRDMSLATFYRAIVALRSYFPTIAALGAARAPWRSLKAHGEAAEAVMLSATGGVNTHRGAIFHLGLLCAAIGALHARGRACTSRAACAFVRSAYGPSIRSAPEAASGGSHGLAMARRHGRCGARAEAAGGFLSVRRFALPAFREVVEATGERDRAAVHALFALVANVADSNLLWRGGREGLASAQRHAQRFLARGGVLAPGWREAAVAAHDAFVAEGLSPGGSADLLAVTLLLDEIDREAWKAA